MTKVSVLSIVLVLVVFLLGMVFPAAAQEEPGADDCLEVIINLEDGRETMGPCIDDGEPGDGASWVVVGDERPLPDGVSLILDDTPEDTDAAGDGGEIVEVIQVAPYKPVEGGPEAMVPDWASFIDLVTILRFPVIW